MYPPGVNSDARRRSTSERGGRVAHHLPVSKTSVSDHCTPFLAIDRHYISSSPLPRRILWTTHRITRAPCRRERIISRRSWSSLGGDGVGILCNLERSFPDFGVWGALWAPCAMWGGCAEAGRNREEDAEEEGMQRDRRIRAHLWL
jgi:hypothetical protein